MLKGLRKRASILSLTSNYSQSSTNSNGETNFDRVLNQVHDFEIALQAMDYLLDDRTQEGTKLLKDEANARQESGSDQPAGIFPLALGVMEFIEATLGFEPEVMDKAMKTLNEAEAASLANSKYNVKYNMATSCIYPPGTEFQVTYAESTLLNALLMLLKENNGMVEGAKALFKLRRAYQTLDSIYKKIKDSEGVFNKNLARVKKESIGRSVSSVDLPGFEVPSATSSSASLPEDLRLMKNLEKVYQMRKSRVEGTNINQIPENTIAPPNLFEGLDLDSTRTGESITSSVGSTGNNNSPSADNHLHVSTVDEFIHSGVQLCFGILQVVLSLIPPTIGKVLSIVGFRGDRETGLKMLWRTAITSRNIHGDLALLCLLVFYDGPVQFVDVGFQLPGHEDSNVKHVLNIESKTTISEQDLSKVLQNPNLYTPQLLKKVRHLFPHNALWLSQEGRILASQGQLHRATAMMQEFTDDESSIINMQQVEALMIFDRAMLYSFQHDYVKAARDFIYLIDINSWSKGVYLYMAAACYLEHYRALKMGLVQPDDTSSLEEELAKYEKLAFKYFELAPTYVPGHGINASQKKGGIGGSSKQMPFDKFLLRKMKHIEGQKSQYPNIAYVDLVGTSLIHELVYFWNGYNRMDTEDLQISLKLLGYSGAIDSEYSANTKDHNYAKINEIEDEAHIRFFLQALVLRSLGEVEQGQTLIDTKLCPAIIVQDFPQFRFHKSIYSPYLYPTVMYEKAMFTWMLHSKVSDRASLRLAVAESKGWLKRAEHVGEGDYELSNRTGMRIKAAGDRLDQLGKSINI
ncbi:mitochondrial outer membrane protein IML2 [Scheffersomyces amazonensis]|uniref:mitochondrial outer membrane protein IML2 n=1 Tax=Scheffersomyces amazonensis TaxID=1078765 RepID=UPI00315CB070